MVLVVVVVVVVVGLVVGFVVGFVVVTVVVAVVAVVGSVVVVVVVVEVSGVLVVAVHVFLHEAAASTEHPLKKKLMSGTERAKTQNTPSLPP